MIPIIIKDFKIFIKDIKGLLLYIILPMVLITIFVLAYGNMGKDYEPINLIVVNNDGGTESLELISDLAVIKNIKLLKTTSEVAEKSVKAGKVVAALFINRQVIDSINNNKAAFEIIYDQSNEYEFGIIKQFLMPQLSKFIIKSKIEKDLINTITGSDPNPNNFESLIKAQINNKIENSNVNISNVVAFSSIVSENMTNKIGLIQGIAGTAVLMLLFGVRGAGGQIIEERYNKTLLRTLFLNISPNVYLLSKFFSTLLIALIQIFIMFIFSAIVFEFDIFYNFPALIIVTFLTALACSSFSIFIGTIVSTQSQLNSLSIMIILVMSAIGGSMIPSFIMPAIMKKMAIFSINYWSIQGFYDIYLRDFSLLKILPRIYVLLGFSFVSMILSYYFFKNKIKNIV